MSESFQSHKLARFYAANDDMAAAKISSAAAPLAAPASVFSTTCADLAAGFTTASTRNKPEPSATCA